MCNLARYNQVFYLKPCANRRKFVGQQLPTLLDAPACCMLLCVLLKVVAQNLKLVKLLSQQLPTFLLFRDRRSVVQQCSIRCTALPNLLGPRTCITYALQSLMGFILHTMHCSSQHCCELLHPFVQHYQHGRNSSPTMLGVVAFVCT